MTARAQAAVPTADPACETLLEALDRIFQVPSYRCTTATAAYTAGKPRQTEQIYTGTAAYLLSNGKWRKFPGMPQSMQSMRQSMDEAARGTAAVRFVYAGVQAPAGL